MKILVCPDKFKGSLTAPEVCTAIASGIRAAMPVADIDEVPLADGGEGTCLLLTRQSGGTLIEREVAGPRFESVRAAYGLSGDRQTAFIEMAAAAGLMLLDPDQRNPRFTTTFGVGELIGDALNRGVRHIVLGIGGSATNDAGIGMAAALGFQFLDAEGNRLEPVGESLIHLRRIARDAVHPRLNNVAVTTLCDVANPLYGPDGAARVYAPQKGADPETAIILDNGLRNFSEVVGQEMKISANFPGAGAAGGLGAGAKVFLGATPERGIDFMMSATKFHQRLVGTDIIVTGEGRLDGQTLSGKVVSEVCRIGKKAGIPVIAVCGSAELTEESRTALGLAAIESLVDENTPVEIAIRHAPELIAQKIKNVLTHIAAR